MQKKVDSLVVDTTAFIQNAPLQDIGANIFTTQDVVDEIKNKRQLRRLVVLPYELQIKVVYPENIKTIIEFSKKTGDYPSLSATDISVMALTFQLEKEKVGVDHLRTEPIISHVKISDKKDTEESCPDITGFFVPDSVNNVSSSEERESVSECNDKVVKSIEDLNFEDDSEEFDDILIPVSINDNLSENESEDLSDDEGWITPKNVQKAKQQIDSDLLEEKESKVACITTDFAMQNVLKQMNLNVAALDGRIIKQLRTFILRCYTCFKTTSVMTKLFCPKCGNNTLKRVAVSLDQNGQQVIHINARRPLTGRGKKFSLPTIKGGKHSNNPLLVADQPVPDQRPTRLAKMKNNPLNDDYIAGYSPFIMRDVNSKSAQLKIRPGTEVKHWMKKNPNEARRKRK